MFWYQTKVGFTAINSRLNNSENEYALWKIDHPKSPNQNSRQKQKCKKKKKKYGSIRDLFDNIKHANLGIIEIPEGEERGKKD